MKEIEKEKGDATPRAEDPEGNYLDAALGPAPKTLKQGDRVKLWPGGLCTAGTMIYWLTRRRDQLNWMGPVGSGRANL